MRALWPALAAKTGVDAKSVTWVNVDPNGKIPALKSKAIDVTTNFYNLHELMKRELGDDMGYLSWAKPASIPTASRSSSAAPTRRRMALSSRNSSR